MAEQTSPQRFARELANQDPLATSAEYAAHRRRLEQRLARWQVLERWLSVAAAVAFGGAVILMFVGGSQAAGSFDPTDRDATALSIALGGLFIACNVTWPVALAVYFSRCRPGIRETKDQLLQQSLSELQNEVQALRRQVAARA